MPAACIAKEFSRVDCIEGNGVFQHPDALSTTHIVEIGVGDLEDDAGHLCEEDPDGQFAIGFADGRNVDGGAEPAESLEELYATSDYVSIHIPATPQTIGSIGYDLVSSMPKGATLVNTARKEVIDEEGLLKALEERPDLKYITDVAPDNYALLQEKCGLRVFATPKKMGAQTAEANVNAGLAAARQIVDYFATGNVRFQVNK